jgi:glycosyltransferase involved in cell wall biosynthesis
MCYVAGVKILWASPLPPTRSGVSDYAAELLPEIGALAQVRVLTPPEAQKPEAGSLGPGVEFVPFDAPAHEDEVSLIHLGNNPHHMWLLDRLKGRNTLAVMHDLVLHHLLVESSGGESDDLEKRLRVAHGGAGATLGAARRFGLTAARDPFLFPARSAFIEGLTGAIVHSEWGRDLLQSEFPDLRVGLVGLAVADPGPIDRMVMRREIGVADDETVLMHLGFMTPEKGLDAILTGLAAARKAGVNARLFVVGENGGGKNLKAAAAAESLADAVTFAGWVASDKLPSIPAAADLGIVLRTPSAGETSAAAVRFLAAGTPVAVGGLHQFLEWPEEAAPRITPGPSAAAEIARLIAFAAERDERWDRRRVAARRAYEENHRPADTAATIISFLESL